MTHDFRPYPILNQLADLASAYEAELAARARTELNTKPAIAGVRFGAWATTEGATLTGPMVRDLGVFVGASGRAGASLVHRERCGWGPEVGYEHDFEPCPYGTWACGVCGCC